MDHNNSRYYRKKLIDFICSVKIVKYNSAVDYLIALGLTKNNAENTVKYTISNYNILQKNGFLMTVDSVGSVTKYADENFILEKINNLFIGLCNTFDCITCDAKYPCKAVLYNSKNGKALYLFHITRNYAEECTFIDTCFSTASTKISPMNLLIILDDDVNEEAIDLSNNFIVFAVFQNNTLRIKKE